MLRTQVDAGQTLRLGLHMISLAALNIGVAQVHIQITHRSVGGLMVPRHYHHTFLVWASPVQLYMV